MDSDLRAISRIDLEACEWLVRVLNEDVDPDDPLPHPADRCAALCEWLLLSPHHARAFFELLHLAQQFGDVLHVMDTTTDFQQPGQMDVPT